MKNIKSGIRFIKKIDNAVFKFLDGINNDTLYLFDYEEVEEEYKKVKNLYRNNPELFDLKDFASNYSFSFYQKKGILDFQSDADKMTNEIVDYFQSK